jgi:hypothetical protein
MLSYKEKKNPSLHGCNSSMAPSHSISALRPELWTGFN